MSAKFKIVSNRPRSYSERMIRNGFNVFVKSNATTLIDEFFNEHKIWALDFKSKTWSKLMNAATKLNVSAMREVFGSEPDIKWSAYAGCSVCPCSPGYRVRKAFNEESRQYANHDIWADVNVDVRKLKDKLPVFYEMLQNEIQAHA